MGAFLLLNQRFYRVVRVDRVRWNSGNCKTKGKTENKEEREGEEKRREGKNGGNMIRKDHTGYKLKVKQAQERDRKKHCMLLPCSKCWQVSDVTFC